VKSNQYLRHPIPEVCNAYFRKRMRSSCSRHCPASSSGNTGPSARTCPTSSSCRKGDVDTTAGTRAETAAGFRCPFGHCCRNMPRHPRSSCSRDRRGPAGTWRAQFLWQTRRRGFPHLQIKGVGCKCENMKVWNEINRIKKQISTRPKLNTNYTWRVAGIDDFFYKIFSFNPKTHSISQKVLCKRPHLAKNREKQKMEATLG